MRQPGHARWRHAPGPRHRRRDQRQRRHARRDVYRQSVELTSGSIALAPGITFHAELNGPGAGTQYSQLDVTGSVNLGQASLALEVNPNFLPAGAGDLIIIDNDGTDPIVGTFSGLPKARRRCAAGRRSASPMRAAPATTSRCCRARQQLLPVGRRDRQLLRSRHPDREPERRGRARDAHVPARGRRRRDRSSARCRRCSASRCASTTSRAWKRRRCRRSSSHDRTPADRRADDALGSVGYGAHTEKAAGGTALTLVFRRRLARVLLDLSAARESRHGASTATVQYLRESLPALTRTYPIAAVSRFTVTRARIRSW